MKAALDRYPLPRGYTLEDFRTVASEVAGMPLDGFFRSAFESTEELDYSEALRWFGLRFTETAAPSNGWLGASTRSENGRTLIGQVLRDSPAWRAGLDRGR